MSWNIFKTKINFDEQEIVIKETIESMLSTMETVIDIDSINMTFTLLNAKNNCNIHVDSIGVKIDIKQPDKLVALDAKMESEKLTFFKDLIAQEASKRRIKQVKDVFLNRMSTLKEVSKEIKNGTTNSERN